MKTTTTNRRDIGWDDFTGDSHAAKYRGELDIHPAAFDQLFALLNDPANEQRLIDAEMHAWPALAGVAMFIEADPAILKVLAQGQASFRFRQTVGVAVKLKMKKLGWQATGKKGTVRGAKHFTKAERYVAIPTNPEDPMARALAALDSVSDIGDAREREQTGRTLNEALAETRNAQGRPF